MWLAVLSTVYYVMLFCFESLENLHYHDEAQFLLGSEVTINVRQIFDLVNSFLRMSSIRDTSLNYSRRM